MPAIEHFWYYLLAALVAVLGLGVVLGRSLSGRHAYNSEVRWKRRLTEMQAEYELRIATLTKTLRHAEEKQATLRQALDESDETVKLLSADQTPAFEQEITERNNRIAELKKTLSHARAMVADAEDHETTLQKQVDRLQAERVQRDKRIEELLDRDAGVADLQELNEQLAQRCTDMQTALTGVSTELADRNRQIDEMTGLLQQDGSDTPANERQLQQRDSQIASLEAKLKDMREILPGLNETLRKRQASIDELGAELSQERKKNQSLEHTIAFINGAENEPMEAKPGGAKVVSIHEHRLTDDLIGSTQQSAEHDDTEQRVRALESELQNWKRKYEAARHGKAHGVSEFSTAAAEGARSKDDLKQIRGIGPVLETTLNELGFFQFEQIADIGQHDIEQMARHDSSFPGRIRRYQWVEQARKLQERRHTDGVRPDA